MGLNFVFKDFTYVKNVVIYYALHSYLLGSFHDTFTSKEYKNKIEIELLFNVSIESLDLNLPKYLNKCSKMDVERLKKVKFRYIYFPLFYL